MVTLLLIASILLVALYVGVTIWRKKELPPSISEMVFDLPTMWQWVWTAWLAIVDIFAAPALFEAMPENWQFVGFFFIGCLLFVAAMPLVRKSRNKAHEILAIAAGIFSQLCVGIICPWFFLMWVVFAIIPFFDKKWYMPGLPMWMIRSRLFLVEAVCAITLYGSVITRLI